MQPGLLAAVAAYFLWGLFPIYWKWLEHVPALQIMSHRIVWCALFVCGYLFLTQGRVWLAQLNRRLMLMLACSALLISINWWLYIWAVNGGHIVETSLGYFINPLVSVLLGVAILRERLNAWQWLSVGVAGLGVAYLTLQSGKLPWIALVLAFSFGGYGLIRKLAVVPAIPGLAVESSLLLLPALAVLIGFELAGSGSFAHIDLRTDALLVMAGAVTALPLICFAYGARRIPLTLIGVLQYLAPTIQLLVGVFLYGEPFTQAQAIGFGCIWGALAIYAGDGLRRALSSPARAAVSAAPRG